MTQIHIIPSTAQLHPRTRVAAYARVSTDSDTQTQSLAAQVSYYSRLIQSTPGWEYAGVYVDDGITGTSLKHRTGLNELMTHAREGKIDLVLTKSISRLARNTIDLLSCVRELKSLGIPIRFERENIDTSTADGELLLTLLASFAQEESRSLSENVKWAIRKRYTEGGTNSFTIYGYTWDGHDFHINETEAVIVRLLFTNYLKGISPEKTASWLNSHNYRSRGGGKFYGSVMRRMLENERYKGCQHLQKTFSPAIKSTQRIKNDGHLPAYWVHDALPAIIDPAMFDSVQEEIARRRAIGIASAPSLNTGFFTGRIHCTMCDVNYQRKTRHRKASTPYHYWRCWNACKGKGNPCGGHNIRESLLKDVIASTLGSSTFDEAHASQLVDRIEASRDQLTVYTIDGKAHTFTLDQNGHLA